MGTKSGQRGEILEFDVVFDAEASRVWRTLRSLGVHPASLDDALQDVFIIVHNKLGNFVARAQVSTWIYAITYRVAQNYRRRIQRSSHEPWDDTLPSSCLNPENLLAEREAARFVRMFCSQLSEAKRDVFVLCILEERSAPEVAEMLELNLNTVYSRVRITKAEFRAALEGQARKSRRQG